MDSNFRFRARMATVPSLRALSITTSECALRRQAQFRFAYDSPLEEGVWSEPVSELGPATCEVLKGGFRGFMGDCRSVRALFPGLICRVLFSLSGSVSCNFGVKPLIALSFLRLRVCPLVNLPSIKRPGRLRFPRFN